MDVRVLLFLLVLGSSWCCNARVVTTNLSPVQNEIASVLQQINHQQQERIVEAVEEFGAIDQLCTLCKTIAKPLLSFLKNSDNQKTISSVLGKICPLTLNLKDKVSLLTPKTVCTTINLCDLIVSNSQHLSKNSCESCHDLVAEVLLKLKDPDTQLDTTEVLLKACDAVEDFEGFAKKCKTLVSIYAPLILGNAEQFLEQYDVCTILDPCISATNATMQKSGRVV